MKTPAACIVSAAVSALVSATVAVYATKSRLTKKFDEQLELEILKAKNHYSKLHKTGAYSSPTDLVETEDIAVDLIREMHYAAEAIEEQLEDATEYIERVNRQPRIGDLPPEEYAKRTSRRPYVISQTEFMELDGYDDVQLTYYLEDGVIIDPEETVDATVIEQIGKDNLMRFGVGSNDPNVVYVRNERTKTNYEILRSPGSFPGAADDTIEHSHRPRTRHTTRDNKGRPRKFRPDNE